MKVLGIESSAITASVAIMSDECMLAEYTINYKKTHSETLLPMIDEICKMTNTSPDELDVIAVSVGPGSFTGLRIGAATGKGIALALDKKMVSVPTLNAMAYNLYGDKRLICPIMDAKRSHLYAGMFAFEEDALVNVMDTCLISYEDLAKKCNELGREVVFIGDGVCVCRDFLNDNLKCGYVFAPAHISSQRASSVALLGMEMAKRGEFTDDSLLKPDYLRPSQAERELEKKKDR